MAEISEICHKEALDQPWAEVVRKMSKRGNDSDCSPWREFATAKFIDVNGQVGFESISASIESSFATVIDVSGNDPLAYFWLGFCHARGLNAIPVYRKGSSQKTTGDSSGNGPRQSAAGNVSLTNSGKTDAPEERLAFDIHALWYAEYDEGKPYDFKAKLREILQHLLARDLPYRQKRAFWDRFPAERKLKVFTGAMHVEALNREMIGDWDLRTVSELLSYLPSVREAMAIELVTPIYSPEQAYRRFRRAGGADTQPDDESRQRFVDTYRAYIRRQLRDANCIVIASPDVNPVTEFLLHQIYGVRARHIGPECQPFDGTPDAWFTGFVVVKQNDKKPEAGAESAAQSLPDLAQDFTRLFYREVRADDIPPDVAKAKGEVGLRGFGLHTGSSLSMEDPKLFEKYVSQDDCRGPFSLLGHLVVARYRPTPDDPTTQAADAGDAVTEPNLVVLLNGVSGPATFALAQILSGGGVHGSGDMNAESEGLLEAINRILDDNPRCRGVEAIVKVDIDVAADLASQSYLDSRQVQAWMTVGGYAAQEIK